APIRTGGGPASRRRGLAAPAQKQSRGGRVLLEGRPDFVEHRADLGPDRLDRGDDEDRDERGDQRIFNRGDARFVGGEDLDRFEHLFAPTAKPDPAATPVLPPPAWGRN